MTAKIELRCEEGEKLAIQANAKELGVSVTEFVLLRCIPKELVEPPTEAVETVAGIAGKPGKGKRFPDASFLKTQQENKAVYFKRLEDGGIVFDWSKCTHKTFGRCKGLNAPVCDGCIKANTEMLQRKAELDRKIQTEREDA